MIRDYFNKFCTIKSRVLTPNSKTNQMVESFTNKYVNIPCRLEPISGSEFPANATYLSKATHILYIDKVYTTQTDSVTINSVDYDILFIDDAAGHGHHYELILEVIK